MPGRATRSPCLSATKYGTLTFKVLGKAQSGYGAPYISVWNNCTDDEDGNRWVSRSYAWTSTSVAGSSHVSARHVDAYVTAVGDNDGFYDVAKVQLTYKYAKLRVVASRPVVPLPISRNRVSLLA